MRRSMHTREQMAGGLPIDTDWMLAEPPAPPFDWVREGTSYWVFDDKGEFAIPRIGVEAEPHSWENRSFHCNLALADGRLLLSAGRGPMPKVIDDTERPAVMGAGPVTFHVSNRSKSGGSVSTAWSPTSIFLNRSVTVSAQGARCGAARVRGSDGGTSGRAGHLAAEALYMGQRQAARCASVGLGWRFQQLMHIEGEYAINGVRRTFRGTGNRVKRRSVRTDGLFLRGHCWQSALFPDGRGFGFEVRPVHDEGLEPWNEAYTYQDGRMHHGKVVKVPWLDKIIERGEDVSVEIQTDLGLTHISGRTHISTFRISNPDIWGLNLHQAAARYTWDGQTNLGMIERSTVVRA